MSSNAYASQIPYELPEEKPGLNSLTLLSIRAVHTNIIIPSLEDGDDSHLKNLATWPYKCSTMAHVLFKDISKFSLPINESLMQYIVNLDLSYRSLGNTPNELEFLIRCTSIKSLNMDCNELEGHVQHLSHLTGLTNLNVHRNKLKGHVQHLSHLTGLTILNVSENMLGEQEVNIIKTSLPSTKVRF